MNVIYYKKYKLLYWKILKNGTAVFTDLLNEVLGEGVQFENIAPIDDTTILVSGNEFVNVRNQFTIVRNPYDRLVSQFYHSEFLGKLGKNDFKNMSDSIMHFEAFHKWVKDTYGGDGSVDNQHFLTQTKLMHYRDNKIMKFFKLEELKYHQLFWFMKLSDEEKWEIDRKGEKWKQFHTSYGHHSKGFIRKGELMDYYNDDTIKICNEYFLVDFQNFGYQMIEI